MKNQETVQKSSRDSGRAIKLSIPIYDIVSSMMTGSESYNETISKVLVDYLKTHKKERDLVQSVLDSRNSKISLKEFIENGTLPPE